MKNIISKPPVYGSLIGAIAGCNIGIAISITDPEKDFSKLCIKGALIGATIGNAYASISDLNSTRQVIEFLKIYRSDELTRNLFA